MAPPRLPAGFGDRTAPPAAFFAGLGLAVVFLGLLPWSMQAGLVYERGAVRQLELWRLVTASLVHVRWPHLLWNLLALAAIGAAVGRRFGVAGWTWIGCASALGAGAGLFLFSPDTLAMVGLSALLHGLAAAGALAELFRGRRGLGLVLLAALVAKLAWEQWAGPLPGVTLRVGGGVAVDAHLYGASAGLLAAAPLLLRRPPEPAPAPR